MDTIIVNFLNLNNGTEDEIEIPLSITANDLIYALSATYNLGLNSEDVFGYYLCSENPIAFLRGEKTLSDFKLRNGSKIIYKR